MQFEHLRSLIEVYTYFILFPLAVVEGPVVTILAGFLAHIRILNFYTAYLVIVLADVTGDVLWYSLGRFARGVVERFGHLVGLGEEKMRGIDKHFGENGQRTVFFGKLFLGVEIAFLISAGMAKFDFKKYAIYTLLPTLPKSLMFMLIGYFFGGAFVFLDSLLKNIFLSVLVVLSGVFIFYFVVYRFIMKKLSGSFK
jgi:membrane protein DedA with SNARE-associated domain